MGWQAPRNRRALRGGISTARRWTRSWPRNDAAGTVRWGLGDHEGTIRDVIDSSGNLQSHVSYNSFGTPTGLLPSNFRFGYTGRPWDVEAGLYDLRARYYDSLTGRFLSEDPTGLGPDVNPYRYCGNNPVARTDPTGLCDRLVNAVGSSIVSAAGSFASGIGTTFGGVFGPVTRAQPAPWLLAGDPVPGYAMPTAEDRMRAVGDLWYEQTGGSALMNPGGVKAAARAIDKSNEVMAATGAFADKFWGDFYRGVGLAAKDFAEAHADAINAFTQDPLGTIGNAVGQTFATIYNIKTVAPQVAGNLLNTFASDDNVAKYRVLAGIYFAARARPTSWSARRWEQSAGQQPLRFGGGRPSLITEGKYLHTLEDARAILLEEGFIPISNGRAWTWVPISAQGRANWTARRSCSVSP